MACVLHWGQEASPVICQMNWARPEKHSRRHAKAHRFNHVHCFCRFEQLALGYNSDEFGELDSDEEDASAGPRGHDVNDYSAVLDQFLAKHATHDHAHEGGQVYSLPSKYGEDMTEEEHEAAIAIAKVGQTAQSYIKHVTGGLMYCFPSLTALLQFCLLGLCNTVTSLFLVCILSSMHPVNRLLSL